MKTLRFDGPAARLRENGELVPRGGTFDVTNQRAVELLKNPRVDVVDVTVEPAARTGEGQETGEANTAASGNDETKE